MNILIKKQIVKLVYIFVCIFVLAGCANGPLKREHLNELVIRNTTSDIMSDVSLEVERDGANTVVATNAILPHSEFSLGFQPQKNKRRPMILSWNQGREKYQRDISPHIQKNIDKSESAKLVILVWKRGAIQATIEQDYNVK
ncbi:MAG: hypothetical protein OCC45_01495 [Desulfotalea sp.]